MSGGTRYVAPHMRRQESGGGGSSTQTASGGTISSSIYTAADRYGRGNKPPDMASTTHFPSLSAMAAAESAAGGAEPVDDGSSSWKPAGRAVASSNRFDVHS